MTTVTSTTTLSGGGILFTQEDTNLTISVDEDVTMQGNEFNGANQLVQLDENGALPAVDGSQLTGVQVPTLDTSNMPTLANNAVTPATQIDFSEGTCWDDTLTQKIVSTAMTKKLDETFAAGTGNGGLDTGSIASDTWYHCFAISKTDGTNDFLFSTSVSSPTMPNNYVYKRRLGSIKTDSSSEILAFLQVHDTFLWDTKIQDLNKTSGFSSEYQNLTVSTPFGVITEGLFGIQIYLSQNGTGFTIASKLCTDNGFAAQSKGAETTDYALGSVLVDTLSQVKYKSYSTDSFHYAKVYCNGWKDFRGIR